MNRRNIYTVPDFTVKDIVSYFSEMDLSINASDLLKPNNLTTTKIYECILELFQGPSPLSNDESLYVIKLVQRMGSFLFRLGFQGFTVRDLSPDSKRLIQILSTIINFSMYRDNKREIYEKVSQIADNNYAIKRDQENQILTLKQQIESVQNRLDDNFKLKETMEANIYKLESELKQFYKYQKDKVSEVSLLRAEKTEIEDKISASEMLTHNLKQEIMGLKSQIVSDPSKLMELVEEMKQLIEKEREAIALIEKNTIDSTNKLNRSMKISDNIVKAFNVIKEIRELEDQIEDLDQKTMLKESKIKNWESNINALKIRINHVDRQISHLESKIQNLQCKDKKYSEEISTKIVNLKIKYENVNDERGGIEEKIKENNKNVQQLLYDIARVGGEHNKESGEVLNLLVKLNSEIELYFSEINTILDN